MNEYIAKYKALDLPGKLIAINVIIWSLLQVARLFYWLITGYDFPWQNWLALHADLQETIFKPWTLFTYSFTHANLGDNVFHILFNMLWLWFFGHFFLRLHSGKQLLGTYLLGGLFAGAFYLLAFNTLPGLIGLQLSSVVGSSGAIFALVATVAIRQPEEPIYLNFFVKVIPVKMKWFALFALFINLMNLANGENTGGIICHLGGMLLGAAFGICERHGIDPTRHVCLCCDQVAEWLKPRPKMKATRGGTRHVPNDRKMDHDFNEKKHADQERINAILDKISKSGYDGLTAEEKTFLFSASQRRKS